VSGTVRRVKKLVWGPVLEEALGSDPKLCYHALMIEVFVAIDSVYGNPGLRSLVKGELSGCSKEMEDTAWWR
jgi:hypothetical protein